MKRVIVESPLAGDFKRNRRYARLCLLDCLRRGEAPYASHLLYPQMLDDEIQEERDLGIQAGLAWGEAGEIRVVYTDLGTSRGMEYGVQAAKALGQPVEYRKLPPDLMKLLDSDEPIGNVTRGF
jgi:hypothetical protein